MAIARLAVPVALVLAVLLACLAPSPPRQDPQVTAKEVLFLAQKAGEHSYTYSRSTAAELERVRLERPQMDASCQALEQALAAAGFSLTPVGGSVRKILRVGRGQGEAALAVEN
jgi:hypothetical protein